MLETIRPTTEADWAPVTRIFNTYVETSLAAYPDQPVDEGYFSDRHSATPDYPFLVSEIGGRVVGFAFLAHISSANQASIRFHSRHGFTECGRFREVGEKHGTVFDMVWMQLAP